MNRLVKSENKSMSRRCPLTYHNHKNENGCPILFTLTTERAPLSRVGGLVDVFGLKLFCLMFEWLSNLNRAGLRPAPTDQITVR